MRARIYNINEKKYYISEVYGILNCGINLYLVDKENDPGTIVLVEYLNLSSKIPYDVNVEKIDINSVPEFKWVYKQKKEVECINNLLGEPGKIHYFAGYESVWKKKEALVELINKGYIDKKKLNVINISTKLKGWNYIESREDISYLMEEFSEFHDSVIKEFSYITGDCVSRNGVMQLSEAGNKRIKIVFESQCTKGIELVFLAPRYVQLVPPGENYSADLYDASIFIKDCMVYFYDSYMETMPNTYGGTYISAMGMMWKKDLCMKKTYAVPVKV